MRNQKTFHCPSTLDSRLRGNDGGARALDSRLREYDGGASMTAARE